MDHMNKLLTCRTPQDFAAAQSDMVRETVETALESSRRIADMSLKMADETGKQIKQTHGTDPERRLSQAYRFALNKSGCRKPLLRPARSSSICEFIRDPLFLEACSKRSRYALHSGSTQHSANDFSRRS